MKQTRSGSAGRQRMTLLMAAIGLTMLLMASACHRGNKDFSEATLSDKAEEALQDFFVGADDSDNTIPEAEGSSENIAEETEEVNDITVTATNIVKGPRNHDRIHINPIGRLREVFNDSNKYQYAAAERLGIRPLSSVGATYFTTRPIVHVESNKFYTVDSLSHSFPYLVPEAEKLLRKIGANFIDSLSKRGGDSYRILVTSLLRTPHTVKKLRRINRNAVDSSTHQFGTTFDISFTRFDNLDSTRTLNEEDLKNLLAEVLQDLRKQNRCLVKYEHKGGCFHITTTR